MSKLKSKVFIEIRIIPFKYEAICCKYTLTLGIDRK